MKLIKTEDEQGVMYSLSGDNLPENYILSKENCDDIFGVVDVEKLVDEEYSHHFFEARIGFRDGFNKAMELNKKVFALDDMIMQVKAAFYNGVIVGKGNDPIFSIDDFVQSIRPIQDPTEIEVEIVMECLDPTCDGVNRKGCCIPGDKPKLDSSGCLILRKL